MKRLLLIIACTVMMLFISSFSQAQQTIFNIPSADATDKGKIYLGHASQFRLNNPGRYWYVTDYFAYGLGNQTDLEATLYNTSWPVSGNVSLGVGFKSTFPLLIGNHSKAELCLTVGSQALFSLQGNGIGVWGYSHLSGKIPKTKTRLTAGISVGHKQLFGKNTVHFIGGVEQPVIARIALIADWYSGKHALGFATFGGSILIAKSSAITVGYQVPNDSKVAGKPGFTFGITKFF